MIEQRARDQLLADIRQALYGKEKSESSPVTPGSPFSSRADLDSLVPEIQNRCEERRAQLLNQFETELKRIGGYFHRAQTEKALFEYIAQVASVRQAKTIVAWDTPLFNNPSLQSRLSAVGVAMDCPLDDPELVGSVAAADIGVSGVDYALADTGTLVLRACKGQARSISLLPPVHIAVIRPSQMLSGLSDLMPVLRADSGGGREMCSAVTFITGPSRTADIELKLVVGVHGPQELHVVVLG